MQYEGHYGIWEGIRCQNGISRLGNNGDRENEYNRTTLHFSVTKPLHIDYCKNHAIGNLQWLLKSGRLVARVQ